MRDALGRTLNKRENDLMMLRNAVDAMMSPLGYHGTISARDDRVQEVMDALAHVDTARDRQTSACVAVTVHIYPQDCEKLARYVKRLNQRADKP